MRGKNCNSGSGRGRCHGGLEGGLGFSGSRGGSLGGLRGFGGGCGGPTGPERTAWLAGLKNHLETRLAEVTEELGKVQS